MLIETIAIVSCLVLMIIGSYTDLERREVPDWANYSMIMFGVGINLVYSLIVWDFSYLLYSCIGLAASFLVAMLMFYSGQWGGGDSKMLMAIGAILGFNPSLNQLPLLSLFFIGTFIIGAFYGLAWSIGLAIKNRKQFWKRWKDISDAKSVKFMKIVSITYVVAMIGISFKVDILALKQLLWMSALLVLIMYFTFVFIKAVEKSCMIHSVKPSELTEGDWILEDIYVKKLRFSSLSNCIHSEQEKELKLAIDSDLILKFLKEFNILPRLKAFRKKSLINKYAIDNEMIVGEVSKKLYCYSKNPFEKMWRHLKYLIIFVGTKDSDIYYKIVKKMSFSKSNEEFLKFSKNLDDMGINKTELALQEVYQFKNGFDYIAGPKDLGISKENITKLTKLEKLGKMKKVLIKNGVPFVPSFLLTFLVLIFFRKSILMFLG